MKKTYNFALGKWNIEDFNYAYSPACKAYKEFLQEKDFVTNSFNQDISEYDYISIITKKKYSSGVKLSAKCSFDSFGAPLIVITDDVSHDKNGNLQYGLHFEVVAWENGCNVWHIVPFPARVECPRKSTLINSSKFEIEDGEIVDIEVEVGKKELFIDINGQKLTVSHDELPESFHVGITACEGVNHFYAFSIENRRESEKICI